MQYCRLPYAEVKRFCRQVFCGYGFDEEQSDRITEVLLAADLSGIESHGIQRLVRYHKEITEGLVDVHAVPEIVKETPVSATIEGHNAMGQLLGIWAMDLAIDKEVFVSMLKEYQAKVDKKYLPAMYENIGVSAKPRHCGNRSEGTAR